MRLICGEVTGRLLIAYCEATNTATASWKEGICLPEPCRSVHSFIKVKEGDDFGVVRKDLYVRFSERVTSWKVGLKTMTDNCAEIVGIKTSSINQGLQGIK